MSDFSNKSFTCTLTTPTHQKLYTRAKPQRHIFLCTITHSHGFMNRWSQLFPISSSIYDDVNERQFNSEDGSFFFSPIHKYVLDIFSNFWTIEIVELPFLCLSQVWLCLVSQYPAVRVRSLFLSTPSEFLLYTVIIWQVTLHYKLFHHCTFVYHFHPKN